MIKIMCNRYRSALFLSAVLLCFSLAFGVGQVSASESVSEDQLTTSTSFDESMSKGMEAYTHGKFVKAAEYWEQAKNLAITNKRVDDQARALIRKAEALRRLGRFQDAISIVQGFLDQDSSNIRVLDQKLMAELHNSLGQLYLHVNLSEPSRLNLEKSVEIARHDGLNDLQAIGLVNLGNLLRQEGDREAAKLAIHKALELIDSGKFNLLNAKSLNNLASIYIDEGQYEQAGKLLEEVLDRSKQLEARHEVIYLLIRTGLLMRRLHELQGDKEKAFIALSHSAFDRASRIARKINDLRSLSYALGYMSQLYERNEQYEDALTLSLQAVFFAQQENATEILYLWQWQAGRQLKVLGRIDEAIMAYRRAAALQSVRPELVSSINTEHASYTESTNNLYIEFADLLLANTRNIHDQSLVEANLREARDTIESLKTAELQDYFQDDCVATPKSKAADIENIASETGVLYPIILDDRIELLLSVSDRIKQITVPVSKEKITKRIRKFRQYLEKGTTRQYLPHSKALYNWLIRPLEGELKAANINTLVVVPGGPLRTIPLSSLHDGSNFIVHRYAIVTTPALTLTDPKELERRDMQLLVNGLTESVQGFPGLPNVHAEIDAIQSIYGGNLLKNQTYLLGNLQKEISEHNYSVVHIASHGQFKPDPKNTFLLTYDDKLTMDKMSELINLRSDSKQPVELLTLSACQTAAGDDKAALGLAGIAIKAGVRSALATLWFINDQASSLLVSEFYRQLRDPSVSKAVALQQAQIAMMNDRRYRHPSYWSPFLLIGNWL